MANRMTKKDYFNLLRGMVSETSCEDKPELLGFIDHEIDLLTKKSTDKKPTKNQIANIDIKDDIVNALTSIAHPVTITELQVGAPRLATYTINKISALMHQLIEEGRVVKTVDKRKSYFSLAE